MPVFADTSSSPRAGTDLRQNACTTVLQLRGAERVENANLSLSRPHPRGHPVLGAYGQLRHPTFRRGLGLAPRAPYAQKRAAAEMTAASLAPEQSQLRLNAPAARARPTARYHSRSRSAPHRTIPQTRTLLTPAESLARRRTWAPPRPHPQLSPKREGRARCPWGCYRWDHLPQVHT